MYQTPEVYEVGRAIQQAYLTRREEARAILQPVASRSALLAARDQYQTALMLIGYDIEMFDADCQEVTHADH